MITKRTFQRLFVLCMVAAATSSYSQTVLSNGSTVTGIAGSANSERLYRIFAPSGQNRLQFRIFGGAGDCDLYVKRGAPPTTTDWDYRPYISGSNETVNITKPIAGDWYVMLKGFSSYSGESLQGTYSTVLKNGKGVGGNSGAIGSQKYFRFSAPAGQSNLYFNMWGGSGDCDLYVKRGSPPTTSVWDFRPDLNGNVESVTVNNPLSGDWYVMLKGYDAYASVAIKATSSVVLANNQIVSNIAGNTGDMKFYQITVPSGQYVLDIGIRNGSGDCDLYVKRGSLPTTSNWDYRPLLNGNEELVTVFYPTPGIWYIMLRGFQTYSGVTLQPTYAN